MRLTLLGVGAMNSPRFAPAGLLLRYARRAGDAGPPGIASPESRLLSARLAVAFDGGEGAEPPARLDAWLVTDERAELRTQLRRLAAQRGLTPAMTGHAIGELRIEPLPVAHTSHPTCGYAIRADGRLVVWAPEFWTFPAWAAGADLMFADAAGWDRPIRFRGGVGGHASVAQVAADAAKLHVKRLVFAHIGRPSIRAIDAGLRPPSGEWGVEGRTYTISPFG